LRKNLLTIWDQRVDTSSISLASPYFLLRGRAKPFNVRLCHLLD